MLCQECPQTVSFIALHVRLRTGKHLSRMVVRAIRRALSGCEFSGLKMQCQGFDNKRVRCAMPQTFGVLCRRMTVDAAMLDGMDYYARPLPPR